MNDALQALALTLGAAIALIRIAVDALPGWALAIIAAVLVILILRISVWLRVWLVHWQRVLGFRGPYER